MLTLFLVLAVVSHGISAAILEVDNRAVTIVSRAEWGARAALNISPMATPVPFVTIHHSSSSVCTTNATCAASMRSVQNLHMEINRWPDIGYSFGVGGDGRAYEGRGWVRFGAHTVGYNDRSIGICLIGSFLTTLPTDSQITAVHELIALGVSLGHISPNYKLIGHRQAVLTECPGHRLYEEIKTWPHYLATSTYEDLSEGKFEHSPIEV